MLLHASTRLGLEQSVVTCCTHMIDRWRIVPPVSLPDGALRSPLEESLALEG